MDFKEKSKNARAIIVLTASLISWLLNIKYERDIVDSLIILIIVIITFYFIASVAIKLIDKIRQMEPKEKLDQTATAEGTDDKDSNEDSNGEPSE